MAPALGGNSIQLENVPWGASPAREQPMADSASSPPSNRSIGGGEQGSFPDARIGGGAPGPRGSGGAGRGGRGARRGGQASVQGGQGLRRGKSAPAVDCRQQMADAHFFARQASAHCSQGRRFLVDRTACYLSAGHQSIGVTRNLRAAARLQAPGSFDRGPVLFFLKTVILRADLQGSLGVVLDRPAAGRTASAGLWRSSRGQFEAHRERARGCKLRRPAFLGITERRVRARCRPPLPLPCPPRPTCRWRPLASSCRGPHGPRRPCIRHKLPIAGSLRSALALTLAVGCYAKSLGEPMPSHRQKKAEPRQKSDAITVKKQKPTILLCQGETENSYQGEETVKAAIAEQERPVTCPPTASVPQSSLGDRAGPAIAPRDDGLDQTTKKKHNRRAHEQYDRAIADANTSSSAFHPCCPQKQAQWQKSLVSQGRVGYEQPRSPQRSHPQAQCEQRRYRIPPRSHCDALTKASQGDTSSFSAQGWFKPKRIITIQRRGYLVNNELQNITSIRYGNRGRKARAGPRVWRKRFQ